MQAYRFIGYDKNIIHMSFIQPKLTDGKPENLFFHSIEPHQV